MSDEITDTLYRLYDKSYYRGHLRGFLLGVFAGGALAVAVVGALFS